MLIPWGDQTHTANMPCPAAVIEHTLCGGGFASINVSNNANISDAVHPCLVMSCLGGIAPDCRTKPTSSSRGTQLTILQDQETGEEFGLAIAASVGRSRREHAGRVNKGFRFSVFIFLFFF